MKGRKILFGILVLIVVLTVTGCGSKKNENNNESNTTINEDNTSTKIEENTQSGETVSDSNKAYIEMEVESMADGKITKYEVDCYAHGEGSSGLSNTYYYVKDNELYHVSAENPEVSEKVATGIEFVMWDEQKGFIVVASETANIIEKDHSYLSYTYTNMSKELKVNSMNDSSISKEYVVDNSINGKGSAGLSNTYYYVKDNELYYVSAENPKVSIKIATGVIYITFSTDEKIDSFLALTNSNFKYVNEKDAYLLETISLNK